MVQCEPCGFENQLKQTMPRHLIRVIEEPSPTLKPIELVQTQEASVYASDSKIIGFHYLYEPTTESDYMYIGPGGSLSSVHSSIDEDLPQSSQDSEKELAPDATPYNCSGCGHKRLRDEELEKSSENGAVSDCNMAVRPRKQAKSSPPVDLHEVGFIFRDMTGILQAESSFEKCATVEALFDEAYEAGIVDQGTRMLHIEINETRFPMRVGKQETFESKLLGSLRSMLKQEAGVSIVVTVTKAY